MRLSPVRMSGTWRIFEPRDWSDPNSPSSESLLDSLLSSLGPLVCLTSLVPEANGCPSDVSAATLDNIAYIMPGIG